MNARLGRALLIAPGVVLFLLVVAIPAIALILRSIQLGRSDAAAPIIEARQLGLLATSIWLAAGGAVCGVLLSLPAAYVVGRIGRLSSAPGLGAVLLAPLLLPPMVYAFGWQRMGLASLPGELCCIWVWASWLWPIPAVLIGTGWARRGRSAYEAAVLVTTPAGAFGRVVLPLLVRQGSVAVLIMFVLLLGEYSVPHSCGVVVLGTELLGWAAQSNKPADVLVPALPLIALTTVVLVVLAWLWRRHGEQGEASEAASACPGRLAAVLLGLVGLTVLLPLGWLAIRFRAWRIMPEAVGTYGAELGASVAVAAAAGGIALVAGVSLASSERLRRWTVPGAVLFGVLPGALAAEGVLAAYQQVRLIYCYWPLLVIGYAARYGWIGLLGAWLAHESADRDLVGQARIDGASETAVSLRVRYLPNAALLLCAVGVVAGMSLAEVAVGTLLTVPGIGPISAILLEKFHRLEDGMLMALSLWLVVGAVPAAVLVWAALRIRRSRTVSG